MKSMNKTEWIIWSCFIVIGSVFVFGFIHNILLVASGTFLIGISCGMAMRGLCINDKRKENLT